MSRTAPQGISDKAKATLEAHKSRAKDINRTEREAGKRGNSDFGHERAAAQGDNRDYRGGQGR